MRKTGLLTIVGFLLLSGTMFAAEAPAEAPVLSNPEMTMEADDVTMEVPSTDAMSTELSAETAEARDWNTEPEWAGFPRPIPTPVPNYCPDCQPCTSTAACGQDPHNGSSLGVCSPPPNSWCPGTTTSVCICY